jgi:BclB C-terminal domain-containing protein
MKKFTLVLSFISFVQTIIAQVGIGTTTPGTTLDVNGGFTIRETDVAITANTATVSANVSVVKLTGTATGTIAITAPAAPNAGQRLTIINTTSGGFPAVLNGFNVPAGRAGEFVYSGSSWQSMLAIGNSMVPYASGAPSTVTTSVIGAIGTVSLVGFGNTISGISLSGGNIDLTGGIGVNTNYGFTIPRSATVKSISVVFSNVVGLSLVGSTITLKAQLYVSDNSSNTYTPVTGASVDLSPGLSGTISLGSLHTGTATGLSIPVVANSRLIFVVSATATGVSLANTVVGYVSGGVSFD